MIPARFGSAIGHSGPIGHDVGHNGTPSRTAFRVSHRIGFVTDRPTMSPASARPGRSRRSLDPPRCKESVCASACSPTGCSAPRFPSAGSSGPAESDGTSIATANRSPRLHRDGPRRQVRPGHAGQRGSPRPLRGRAATDSGGRRSLPGPRRMHRSSIGADQSARRGAPHRRVSPPRRTAGGVPRCLQWWVSRGPR
jgi:hypothetical protein